MDKNAMLMYIKNLRDLEVARWQTSKLYDEAKVKYFQEEESLQEQIRACEDEIKTCEAPEPCYRDVPCKRIEMLVIAISCLIIDVVMILLLLYGGTLLRSALGASGLLAAKICFVPICILAYVCYRIYSKVEDERFENTMCNVKEHERIREYRNRIKQAEAELSKHQAALEKTKEKWNKERTLFEKEQRQIQALLKKAYDLNFLPGPYCSLAAVCFLCEYMSTFHTSLEETLMNPNTKKSVQEVNLHLNAIVSVNQQKVLQNRCKEACSCRIRGKDNGIQILKTCQQTETNPQNAALYAQIAANYAEANVYFNLASCLKS